MDPSSGIPARCRGYARAFSVAFPNDGSQGDKAYFDQRGERPAYILFCDLVRDPPSWTNGICLSVSDAELDVLKLRERRYELVDVTTRISLYDEHKQRLRSVFAFVGQERFTQAADVATGIVPVEYLTTIESGVSHWDEICPGFRRDYELSTRLPDTERIQPLVRWDA